MNKNEIQKPSDKIVKSFYEENKKAYEIPLTRNINYVAERFC